MEPGTIRFIPLCDEGSKEADMPGKRIDGSVDPPAEDEHIIEAIGRTRIVIRNGVVVEVGVPCLTDCPLARPAI